MASRSTPIVIEPLAPASPRLSVPFAALTIAGSDSGGGAGIQADLRTFAAHGLLGCTAITAVTAQNTLGVRAWEGVSPALVRAQIEAVLDDLPVLAAKTGMLGNRDIIAAVADTWERLGAGRALVVDPVMVATSGHRLLDAEAEATLVERLLPLASVLTPNRHEAAVLSGLPLGAPPAEHAEAIARLAPQALIIVKGGHGADGSPVGSGAGAQERGHDGRQAPSAIDLARLPDGRSIEVHAPWVDTTSTHGTGCTLSAAIAARLALSDRAVDARLEAFVGARRWLAGALVSARPVGRGHGPVDHLFELRRG